MGAFLYPLPDSFYQKNTDSVWHGATVLQDQLPGELFFSCPIGTKIRSMTDGEIGAISTDSSGKKYIDVKVTDAVYKLPTQGLFFIRYMNVSGDSFSIGDMVLQGEEIGLSINDGIHINFLINEETVFQPTLSQNQLNQDQVAAYSIWEATMNSTECRGRCWEVLATAATKKTITISTAKGGIKLSPTVDIPYEYEHMIFSDRFMLNNDYKSTALKGLAYAATHELGQNDEGMSYAKLFRMWILYEIVRFPQYGNFRDPTATLDTFAKYWSNIAYEQWGSYYVSYGSDPNKDDIWLKNFFNNIKYPDIYGVTKSYCIEAMNNGPWQNETATLGSYQIPSYNLPVVFSTIVPNAMYPGGHYVLYRSQSASLLSANPAVKS